MTPEQKSREKIDKQLLAAGWLVQDYREMDLSAGAGLAIREFPLGTGSADYLLYADEKAIGVVEAKREGHTLGGVLSQSGKYRFGVPRGVPVHGFPLPFNYESTGTVTQFTNTLEPDARSREVFTFHRPEELIRLVRMPRQVTALLREPPPLHQGDLWKIQAETIQKLETSLAKSIPRALIQMSTGSGKTYTAVNFCYRLIKHAKAKRILFLVDRNNLGRQTLNEFQQFVNSENGYKFTDEYEVQHLRHNAITPTSKVCITTIQRLYSILQGEPEYVEENEEGSLFEAEPVLRKEPLPVVYNPTLPIEAFDFIVVDECHRSIYNLWRQVLEYFDAFLIGLTATPTTQTLGFFNQNLVQDYSHERAVMDGVNVGYSVYRIETQITKDGATLARQPGVFIPHRDRRTKLKKYRELDDDLTYTANQLDRDVVAEDQIRLVLRTFRDKLPELFPGRTEVPKTLVFAKTDLHAEDIVRIAREEFGKGNDFCQKITSKTTGKKPEELLAEFRNSYDPRIAVTVDMIATGTDVKPLECLLFMRNIRSLSYFEQMKGRGCRVMDADALQQVTPDAGCKTGYVIVDAVGVCDEEKSATRPLDRKPSVPLDKLLQQAAAGIADPELASTLASRLARLNLQADDTLKAPIQEAAGGKSLVDLGQDLVRSIDPDANTELARKKFDVPPGQQPSEEQVKEIEQAQVREALKPFFKPKLRDALLALMRSLEQVIDNQTTDQLLRAGFDAAALEKTKSLVASFRQFLEDHKDDIEALQVLYSKPYRAGLKFHHVKDLAAKLNQAPFYVEPNRPESLSHLWKAFEVVEPDSVRRHGGGRQLVDVIALVRHALDPRIPLSPVALTVEERYAVWLAEKERTGVVFTPEQRKWLETIKDHIASSLSIEPEDLEEVPFNQFGGLGKVHELFGSELPAILEELNVRLGA